MVLVARDRNGRKVDFVTGPASPRHAYLQRCLARVVDADILLVTDGSCLPGVCPHEGDLPPRRQPLGRGAHSRRDARATSTPITAGSSNGCIDFTALQAGICQVHGWQWVIDGSHRFTGNAAQVGARRLPTLNGDLASSNVYTVSATSVQPAEKINCGF
jgi:hypothetical protein